MRILAPVVIAFTGFWGSIYTHSFPISIGDGVSNITLENNISFNKTKKPIKKYKLNNEQKKAFDYLDLVNDKFDVSVLQGTTGSGKTLVYFERVKKRYRSEHAYLFLLN